MIAGVNITCQVRDMLDRDEGAQKRVLGGVGQQARFFHSALELRCLGLHSTLDFRLFPSSETLSQSSLTPLSKSRM